MYKVVVITNLQSLGTWGIKCINIYIHLYISVHNYSPPYRYSMFVIPDLQQNQTFCSKFLKWIESQEWYGGSIPLCTKRMWSWPCISCLFSCSRYCVVNFNNVSFLMDGWFCSPYLKKSDRSYLFRYRPTVSSLPLQQVSQLTTIPNFRASFSCKLLAQSDQLSATLTPTNVIHKKKLYLRFVIMVGLVVSWEYFKPANLHLHWFSLVSPFDTTLS